MKDVERVSETNNKTVLINTLLVSKSASKQRNSWVRYEIQATFPDGCDSETLEKTKQGLESIIEEWLQTPSTPTKVSPTAPINWKDRVGPKGAFQIADIKEHEGNQEFEELKQRIGQGMIHEGFFYWLFTDGSIARKVKN
jgi:hypothetical protein